MLAKEQYIGAAILLGIAIGVWTFVVTRPRPVLEGQSDFHVADSLRRDSIARLRAQRDSLREARWERYKDSCKRADDARFAAWAQERQLRYDSARRADSLWHDSVGWRYTQRVKKDTILDLNTADTTALMLIRGIGRYKARRIIAYREQLGGFYSPEQLTDQELSDIHLDTLTRYFIASPDDVRTIDVNRCGISTLNHHPYLRYEQAKAIYELRRKRVRLTQIEDIEKLREIDSTDVARLRFYLRFE